MAEERIAMVLGIDHIQIPIPFGGSSRARAFYTGLLRLEEVLDATLRRSGTVRFALNGQRLDLCEGPRSAPAPHVHVALRVEDGDALIRSLENAGHLVDGSLSRDGRVYALDPFGNRLELIETSSASPLRKELAHG